jgi:rhomboid family GlyGly-CTERM serine protease
MSRNEAFGLFGALALIMVLLQIIGVRGLLEYERTAVLDGQEYWRLLTAHLIHDSVRHLGSNMVGFAVLVGFFPRHWSLLEWLSIAMASIVAIDLGLVLNEPQLDWYVGLSGCLHGVLAAAAVAWWRYESKRLAALLTLAVVAKLGWEQWQGGLPFSGDMPVAVMAHLYGAIGGGIAALSWVCGQHRWSRRT